MLSIASWRSGATSKPEPETAEKVVRRAAPMPLKEPVPILTPPPAPAAVEGEHRGAPRLSAAAVPSISGLTFSPFGAEATLVNISASGLLAECGMPLKIGSSVKAIFEGTFAQRSVEGRVVRTCVVSMAPSGVRYSIGVAFKVPLNLEREAELQSHSDNRPATAAVADPPQPSGLVNRW